MYTLQQQGPAEKPSIKLNQFKHQMYRLLNLDLAFKVLIPSQSKLNSTLDSQTKLAQIYNYAYN